MQVVIFTSNMSEATFDTFTISGIGVGDGGRGPLPKVWENLFFGQNFGQITCKIQAKIDAIVQELL